MSHFARQKRKLAFACNYLFILHILFSDFARFVLIRRVLYRNVCPMKIHDNAGARGVGGDAVCLVGAGREDRYRDLI